MRIKPRQVITCKPSQPLYTSNRTCQPPTKRRPVTSSAVSVDIYEGLDGMEYNNRGLPVQSSGNTQGITQGINSPAPYNIPNAHAYRTIINEGSGLVQASLRYAVPSCTYSRLYRLVQSPLRSDVPLCKYSRDERYSRLRSAPTNDHEETLILLSLPDGF